ncbi:MAG: Rieske 2Fe-2S domain-containing protein [Sphingomonadales bacterium]
MDDGATSEQRPRPSFQEILSADGDTPPPAMFAENAPFLGTADIDKARYFSREWHDREMDLLWPRIWQMACREEQIPEAGDSIVYEVGTYSILIVRGDDGVIRAFFNSCLHRGTQIRPGGRGEGMVVSTASLTCPFHGWSWNLDGSLAHIPAKWDFPHVDEGEFGLRPVRAESWGGFVFINMDPAAGPLEAYLGELVPHFERWPLEDRYIAAHVKKVMPCNWKIAQEAFIEVLHVETTHPQTMPYIGDVNSQYDVFGDHVNRMITPQAVASPLLPSLSEQQIADTFIRELAGSPGPGADKDFKLPSVAVPDGGNARAVMAAVMRGNLTATTGVDHSGLSVSEVLDTTMYQLFPNFMPCGGGGVPVMFRFRPNGDDPDTSILDVMLLYAFPQDGERPPPAPLTTLGIDDSWFDAPELGGICAIFEQDTANMPLVHQGMKAGGRRLLGKPGVTLANYQEIRIRHYHMMLDRYLAG